MPECLCAAGDRRIPAKHQWWCRVRYWYSQNYNDLEERQREYAQPR